MAKPNAEEVENTQNPDPAVLKKELAEKGNEVLAAPATVADATPLDSLIKHPLQNQWTLWYYDCEKSKAWELCQHKIANFDTVEDFWSLFNHIKPPSEIKHSNDYSLFKNGIRPMWEDDINKHGGRWLINLNKFRNSELDRLWLDVILCLIGEGFDYSEDICGVVVNVRARGHKLSVWTASSDERKIMNIGRKLKEHLDIPQNIQIAFEFHEDTPYKRGSSKAPVYTV